jgi:parallel beta-helix repeat protein
MINRKMILSLVVVLTMMTLFIPIVIVTNTNTESILTKNKELKSDLQILPGLVPHDPIIINEDADFETLGFSGDGSKSDPYLIENYQISATFDNAIVVKKTTKHFIIRNCQLYSTGYTIFINNVAPGTCLIENNTLEGINSYTVYILSSDFVNITNNYFDVYRCGLSLKDSRYNIIANNTLIADSGYSSGDNNAALDLVQCFACKIINNSCDNFQMGFYIGSSVNLILANNTIENMGDYSGMYIKDSVLLRIINNTIAAAPMLTGISMVNTDNTTIIYNTITECEFEGLDLNGNSEYNSIYYNNFINNSLGFPQARDNGVNNIWFNTTYNEGNYWSDWIGTGNYSIAGTANSYDEYPLNSRTQADWSIITLPNITPPAEVDDVYEQNDILANARTVALDSFISLKANDNDYYNMTVTDTTIVTIQIEYQEQIPFLF